MKRSARRLTSEQVEVVGVQQLEAEEREDDLDGERTAIHEVAVEQLEAAVKNHDARVGFFFMLGLSRTKQEVKHVARREEKDT